MHAHTQLMTGIIFNKNLGEHLTEKPGAILPSVARDFPPKANSQCRLSCGTHTVAGVQTVCQHLCAHQKSQTLAAIP